MRGKLRALLLIGSCSVLALLGCQSLQRRALFHPTHHAGDSGLARWGHEGSLVGLAREVPSPDNIWLMLPGNTGQAADRARMLQVFPARDSVYILEYPGYGQRSGKPSRRTIDAAALAAYQLLRARYAGRHVCVAGESIGSGPAATLGALPQSPDKLVFIVPFADLKSVGRDYSPHAPMGLLLAGSWNNVESLSNYQGPMEVFGAECDTVIDVRHARTLAASRPQATFHLLPGGHNEWSRQPGLRLRCP